MFFLLLLVLAGATAAGPRFDFAVNPAHPPPEMGFEETATNLISLYDVLDYALGTAAAPLRLNTPLARAGVILFWEVSNISFLETVDHEIGHGQRAREYGEGVAYQVSYNYLPLAPVLGLKSSHAIYLMEHMSKEHYVRSLVGGLEGENVLASVLRQRTYGSQRVGITTWLQSIFSESGTLYYVLTTKPGGDGDVAEWLYWAIRLSTGDSIIEIEDMNRLYQDVRRDALAYVLASPPVWQSLYMACAYPFSSSAWSVAPMIRLGTLGVMPALSYGLTASGTERYFQLYWRARLAHGSGYVGYLPRFVGPTGLCAGFRFADLPLRELRFASRLDAWLGPGAGGAVELGLGRVFGVSALSAALGAKSEGYVRGLPYGQALWFRIAVGAEL